MGHGWSFARALTLCLAQGSAGLTHFSPLLCLRGGGLEHFNPFPCQRGRGLVTSTPPYWKHVVFVNERYRKSAEFICYECPSVPFISRDFTNVGYPFVLDKKGLASVCNFFTSSLLFLYA